MSGVEEWKPIAGYEGYFKASNLKGTDTPPHTRKGEITMNTNKSIERINFDIAVAKHDALYMAVEDIKNRITDLDINDYAAHDYQTRREALQALETEMIERCNAAYDEMKVAKNAFVKAHMMPLPFFPGK